MGTDFDEPADVIIVKKILEKAENIHGRGGHNQGQSERILSFFQILLLPKRAIIFLNKEKVLELNNNEQTRPIIQKRRDKSLLMIL